MPAPVSPERDKPEREVTNPANQLLDDVLHHHITLPPTPTANRFETVTTAKEGPILVPHS